MRRPQSSPQKDTVLASKLLTAIFGADRECVCVVCVKETETGVEVEEKGIQRKEEERKKKEGEEEKGEMEAEREGREEKKMGKEDLHPEFPWSCTKLVCLLHSQRLVQC